jgi:hypothetical protein
VRAKSICERAKSVRKRAKSIFARNGTSSPARAKGLAYAAETLLGGVVSATIQRVPNVDSIVAAMRANPTSVRFAEACRVAEHFFGPPRQKGTSHRVYKMPWPGDPRVNLQDDRGKAKAYQVRQLLEAIDRLGAVR